MFFTVSIQVPESSVKSLSFHGNIIVSTIVIAINTNYSHGDIQLDWPWIAEWAHVITFAADVRF